MYIQKLGMIIVMEPNIEEAVTFYKRLGLALKFHLKNKWAEFELDTIRIGLCPTSRAATDTVRTGIVFEVKDLYGIYNALKDTVTFLGEPTEAVHGIMVSFQDPGGNVIDLYQPTPEKVAELVRKTAEKGDCEQDDCCNQDSDEQENGQTVEAACCGGCCESDEEEA